MAKFELAIPTVLKHEGGYTNNHDDPGGPTNYGISLRFLSELKNCTDGWMEGDLDHDGDIDADDIRKMTPDKAAQLYRSQFWDRYRYGFIVDQDVATKVFDLAVNMGPRAANLLLQKALNQQSAEVLEDGVLGPKTFVAANNVEPKQLLSDIRAQAARHYTRLVERNPRLEVFLKGWLRRAAA